MNQVPPISAFDLQAWEPATLAKFAHELQVDNNTLRADIQVIQDAWRKEVIRFDEVKTRLDWISKFYTENPLPFV